MSAYTVDHVHLLSPDPEATARFYEEMLGARRVSKRLMGCGRVFVDLDLAGLTLLVSVPRPTAPAPAGPGGGVYGLQHLALRVDDLDATVAGLKARGVQFTEGITSAGPGVRITFLEGPDKVMIELLERKEA
jgi:catechol 2,3-dioxygenase-like lactoylglutathione lyase family enzyme